jgi:hypothetical protein
LKVGLSLKQNPEREFNSGPASLPVKLQGCLRQKSGRA